MSASLTPPPRRPRRTTSPIVWALIIAAAALVQVPLVYFYHTTASYTTIGSAKPRKRVVNVRLRPRKPQPKTEKPKPEETPIDGQVVTVRQPEVEQRPEKTRFLAEFDSKVKKETKARPNRDRDQRRLGAPSPEKVSKVQSPQSKSLEESAVPKRPEPQEELPKKTVKAPKSESGDARPKTEMSRDQHTRALVPTLDKQSALANLQAVTGSAGTDDALPDIEDGSETVLNSRRFQHWDFFDTVKRRVRKHWRPARVYRRHDPTGKVYGTKDRLTVLQVTLDSSGKLQRLTTVKDSGMQVLDEEARRALSKAAPFRNPPEGLINKHGVIVFQFGFLFEISTSRFKFFRM